MWPMPSARNKKMIREFGGEVMPYRDLPEPAQLAIAWYMAADGEAWEIPEEYKGVSPGDFRSLFPEMMPFFIKKHGSKKFGYVEIPTGVLIDAVMENPDMRSQGMTSFEDYHRWYSKHSTIPQHSTKNRWPVILSSEDDETLQDGWHRLHGYIRQGAKVIPAVYYP